MVTINALRQFIVEVKETIPGIGFTDLVVDDSEFASLVKERKSSDNVMMIAVVPSFDITGHEHNIKTFNKMMFFFVEKVISMDKKKDEYYTMMHSTQDIARQFMQLLFDEKENQDTFCGIFSDIVEDTIQINPVWEKTQCHGWAVEFDLKSAW